MKTVYQGYSVHMEKGDDYMVAVGILVLVSASASSVAIVIHILYANSNLDKRSTFLFCKLLFKQHYLLVVAYS